MTSDRAWRWRAGACVALAVVAATLAIRWRATEHASGSSRIRATVSAVQALGSDDVKGYARADAARAFDFPRDHGPHPDFRTEWWYYTGNLEATDGRRVGFQLTFFRHALRPGAPAARDSAWATTQAFLAHFALTDVRGGRFFAYERSSRVALGLAGAQSEPFRVWLEDWSAESEGRQSSSMHLRAAEGPVAVDLRLEQAKPVVLQGEHGLSRKGPEPGNASYYYSLTRMPARGTVRIADERLAVQGVAWMDREWGTSALGTEIAGWDWFALQLADGRELMFYQLRRTDGGADRFSAGALIDTNGAVQSLGRDDVHIDVLDTWRSVGSGITYPARWRVTMAARDLALDITPRLAQQELMMAQRYWEGAVDVKGNERGRALNGQGYVELVGYGEREPAR